LPDKSLCCLASFLLKRLCLDLFLASIPGDTFASLLAGVSSGYVSAAVSLTRTPDAPGASARSGREHFRGPLLGLF
jgi:hypothetical protein